MSRKLAMAALAAMALSSAAMADEPRYDRDGRAYHGSDEEYRHKCGSGNGAVGTVVGGVGGALVGNAVGGGTIGTIAGGAGGALLGRHLDKKHTKDKNRRDGC